MKTKRNEDKTELVTICQFKRSYNSVILDKWELLNWVVKYYNWRWKLFKKIDSKVSKVSKLV